MLADFYIPRLSNDMKIAVQKNHLVGQTLYRTLVHSKKTASKKKYNLFTYLLNNCEKILFCTSTNFRPITSSVKIHESIVAPNGLVYNHAYSLLEAKTIQNKKGKCF